MSNNSNNDATTDFYNDLVLATALRLIKDNGYTTTLNIKNELRSRHATIDVGPITFRPNFTQNIVSDAMIVLADNSFFSYTDNGTYRTYFLNTIEFGEKEEVETTLNVSKYDALQLINSLVKGDAITITFKKKDGNIRNLVGTIYSSNTGDGYLKVYDNELPHVDDDTNIRTIDLRRLISFCLYNTTYIISKAIKNT